MTNVRMANNHAVTRGQKSLMNMQIVHIRKMRQEFWEQLGPIGE